MLHAVHRYFIFFQLMLLNKTAKKASCYKAQYLVLTTVQSALHLTSLTDLFTQTLTRLLCMGSIQPYATINARRLLVHISTTVYCQVLIHTAE